MRKMAKCRRQWKKWVQEGQEPISDTCKDKRKQVNIQGDPFEIKTLIRPKFIKIVYTLSEKMYVPRL